MWARMNTSSPTQQSNHRYGPEKQFPFFGGGWTSTQCSVKVTRLVHPVDHDGLVAIDRSEIILNHGRRRPSESVAGVLEGHRLLFDFVGVPFFEPSFANIALEKGCCVHGVLHRLTAGHVQKHSCRLMVVVVAGALLTCNIHPCLDTSEWQRVLASEGGGGFTEGYFPVVRKQPPEIQRR